MSWWEELFGYSELQEAGTPRAQRAKANLIAGANATVTVADNPSTATTDITIAFATPSDGDYKESVRVATAAALPTNTRTGNVLTATANGALATVDGVSLSAGDRLLVKDEATGANNGIYTVTSLGDASNPWVMTRATDADTDAEVTAGMVVPVSEGASIPGGALFQLTTDDPITVNTTALTFSNIGGLVTAAVRGMVTSLGSANTVLTTDGATPGGAWSLIANANVDAAAAIAGTKISPNFGAQNVVTTGNLTADGVVSVGAGGSGSFTAEHAGTTVLATTATGIDVQTTLTVTNGTVAGLLQATASNVQIGANTSHSVFFRAGGASVANLTATGFNLTPAASTLVIGNAASPWTGYLGLGGTPGSSGSDGTGLRAATGSVRLSGAFTANVRNIADTGDLTLLSHGASNAFTVGNSTGTTTVNGLTTTIQHAGTTVLNTAAGGVEVTQVGVGPGLKISGGTNPSMTLVYGTVQAKLQALSSSALFGTQSAHALSVYTTNTQRMRFETGSFNAAIFTSGAGSYGFGDGVLFLANATTAPTGTPTGGPIMWAESGALKGRGTSGTTTTMAAAEPHCPRCGRDYAHEWENTGRGEKLSICVPCMMDALERNGVDPDDYTIERRLAA